jgi:CRP-like cAMP-binding protein
VLTLLERTALDVPVLGVEPNVAAAMTGPTSYTTTIAIRSPADADDTAATFTRWLWYASRRAGLHLDGADPSWSTPDDMLAALRDVGRSRYLDEDDLPAIAAGMRLERWASGELLQHEGVVPDGMRFIRRGRVSMRATIPGHGIVQLDELARGDYLGITTLTKETVTPASLAIDEVEVLFVPQEVMEDLVRQTPLLARDFGRELDLRQARPLRPAPGHHVQHQSQQRRPARDRHGMKPSNRSQGLRAAVEALV